MKKYILFGDAFGIGGWQLYTDSRLAFVSESEGAKAFLIYAFLGSKNTVKLSAIMDADKMNLPETFRPPFIMKRSQIDKIIGEIKDFISYDEKDEYFIEATTLYTAMWGEILAKELKCRSFAYLLNSHGSGYSDEMRAFCAFKYNRHEIAGMSKQTLPDIFSGYLDVTGDERALTASWRSPLCNEITNSDAIKEIKKYKDAGAKVIAYFGTMKPHFHLLCDEIHKYVSARDNRFLFVSLGLSYTSKLTGKQLSIENSCSNCKCINIIHTYPVSIHLFELFDVCIASWGSATAAARAGTPTIRLLNDLDVTPQGIIGITLRSYPYNECEVGKETLAELLDNLLFTGKYNSVTFLPPPPRQDNKKAMEIISNAMEPFAEKAPVEYFDTAKIKCTSRVHSYMRILYSVLGRNATGWLRKNIKQVLKK